MTINPSGRELDRLICSKIYKFVTIIDGGEVYLRDTASRSQSKAPNYSTNLTDAYKLVSKLQEYGFSLDAGSIINSEEIIYKAQFYKGSPIPDCYSHGKTLEHAICIAALSHFHIN